MGLCNLAKRLGRASALAAVAVGTTAWAAETRLVPVVGRAVRAGVSLPARELPAFEARPARVEPDVPQKRRNPPVREIRQPKPPGFRDPARATAVEAPLPAAMSGPLATFAGVGSQHNQTLLGISLVPPDTNGDVSPSHYVQAVNLLFQVFDRNGASLLGPTTISSLYTGFGGACETQDDGDPIVLYDSLADRWLISQFALPAYPNPPFHQCIAISTSGDPTGTWYLYDFVMPGSKLNDYPKFGVWPDAYYMTDNQFTAPTFPFAGGGVFAFDRAKMLAGDPAASFVYFDLVVLDPNLGGMLPADLDGPPPPVGTPNYFAYFTATQFGDPQDALRVFEFRPDFATPANSTFAERPESPIAVPAFDANMCGFARNCIPQPPAVPPASGTMNPLDAIADRLMFRLQYRNFGGHESLVMNHTVDVATNQAGVRYYELRRTLPGGGFAVNERATYAPDAHHRWMGSAAMDKDGNLAVGYSVSSTTVFPSLRYAGRLATDPANGLAQGEAVLFAGTNSQTTSANRWGDYSMLAVDPVDDCTFWYTNEYYNTTTTCTLSNFRCWQTRVGSFRFPTCTGAAVSTGTLSGTVTDAVTGLPIAGATVRTTNGYLDTSDGTGAYSLVRVYPGTYTATASAAGYVSATVSSLSVSGGSTTTRDFALLPTGATSTLSVNDRSVVEGNAGSTSAGFTVSRSPAASYTVTVGYATAAGTAGSADFTAASGTLTFGPGEATQPITVPVTGDTLDEPNEVYYVDLSSPTGAAVLGRSRGVGTIVDDDGAGSSGQPMELGHGAERVRSLASLPGPVEERHFYVLRQEPYSSYEAVVDGISGDLQPFALERLAADGTTVLQAAAPLSGVGSSRSLRWANATGAAVADQRLRARSGGCTTTCGGDDTYRIRFYDTTGSIPRFNNGGTQITVLLLQNPGDAPIAGTAFFWSPAGSLLGSSPFSLPARQTLVLNTSTVGGVAGQSGAVTVAHDGRFGDLSGKAVALEPATGFSFDSPMEPRPR